MLNTIEDIVICGGIIVCVIAAAAVVYDMIDTHINSRH